MAGSARKISTCFPLTETYHELRSMFTSSIDKRLACKWVLIKLKISSCRKLSFINCRKEQKPVLKWGNEIITRQSSRSCPRVCLRSQSYIPPVVCGLQSLDRHARTLAETHQLSLLCNCLPPPLPSLPRVLQLLPHEGVLVSVRYVGDVSLVSRLTHCNNVAW